MQKGRVVLFVTLTTGSFALAAAACEDDGASKFEEREADAAFDSGPGFDLDSNTGQDGSAPVSCDPSLPAAFAPVWKAPTKTAACSPEDLGDYFDACLTNQGPDAGNPCKTWTDAHDTCAKCIEPTDNSGPIQWHRDRYYYTLNVAGCLALERNEPNDGQCPAAYNASIQCQRAACDGCFQAANATFQDFQTCQKSAKGVSCATYESKLGETCGTTYNDPDGGAYDCFRKGDDADQKVHFVRVEGIFCGK
jgi:hypothetical protein